jgi:hypothetical protein
MKTSSILKGILLLLSVIPVTLSAQTNIVLPMYILKTFSGVNDGSKVTLHWDLSSSETLKTIIIEKSNITNEFQTIGEFHITDENKKAFTFTDNNAGDDVVRYRLKLISGEKTQAGYSKVLIFQMKKDLPAAFIIFPAVFKNDITLRIKSERASIGWFQLVSYSGGVVYRQPINLQAGNNSIIIDETIKMPSGNYIAVFDAGGVRGTQKIIKL